MDKNIFWIVSVFYRLVKTSRRLIFPTSDLKTYFRNRDHSLDFSEFHQLKIEALSRKKILMEFSAEAGKRNRL